MILEAILKLLGIVGSLGIFSAGIGYALNSVSERQKTQRVLFQEYAVRYGNIIAALLKKGDFKRSFTATDGEERELCLKLFFLFTEEFYLAEHGYIPQDAWNTWKASVEDLVRVPFFREAWEYTTSQYKFSPKFKIWIDTAAFRVQKPTQLIRDREIA